MIGSPHARQSWFARQQTWHLVALASLVGVIPGLTAPFGLSTSVLELTYWTIVAVGVWVPVAVLHGTAHPVRMLLWTGLFSGIWAGLLQGGLVAIAVERNPEYAASYGPAASVMDGFIVGVSALAIGVLWGFLWGWVAVAWRRFRPQQAAPERDRRRTKVARGEP